MPDATGRLHPFALAFAPFVPDRLAAMHRALAESDLDPLDRDAWTLSRPASELLHDMRPDDGLGGAVTELVALAHAGFLFWQHGERTVAPGADALEAIRTGLVPDPAAPAPATAYYLQLPPRRVWGAAVAGAPPEPLDGWFALEMGGTLRTVAILGLLPGRPGFTVAHVEGGPPRLRAREDGSALFAPILEGGAAAGLWSIAGQQELLELAWRAHHWAQRAGDLGRRRP